MVAVCFHADFSLAVRTGPKYLAGSQEQPIFVQCHTIHLQDEAEKHLNEVCSYSESEYTGAKNWKPPAEQLLFPVQWIFSCRNLLLWCLSSISRNTHWIKMFGSQEMQTSSEQLRYWKLGSSTRRCQMAKENFSFPSSTSASSPVRLQIKRHLTVATAL